MDDSSRPKNQPPRGRTAVAWVVTLVVLGFIVFLRIHGAMAEEGSLHVHSHTGSTQVVQLPRL